MSKEEASALSDEEARQELKAKLEQNERQCQKLDEKTEKLEESTVYQYTISG